jgi:sortase (surface protein transpeptidase)
MMGRLTNDGRRSIAAPAAIVLIVTGAMIVFGLGVLGFARTPSAPAPHAASPQAGTPTAVGSSGPVQPHGLTRSAAVRLSIPAIGVDGGLQHLGLNADHKTMQLPAASQAGWFKQSATPGETGPTIIVGYIASRKGPGVFSRLGRLKVGSHIALRRADGTEVVYGVDKVANYPAKTFPTSKIYAPTRQPTLRLITCGGALRPGGPIGNVVVYGHQVSVH